MSQLKLSKSIENQLKSRGVKQKDICATAVTDMNIEGEYADGYLVLTEQEIFLFQAGKDEGQIHYFKGYSVLESQIKSLSHEFAVKSFSINEISNIHMEYQVSCSVLVLTVKDTEYQLVAFSNQHKKAVSEFVHACEKIQAGEAVEAEEEEELLCCPKCGRMYPDETRKICPKCMNRKTIFSRIMKYLFRYKAQLFIMAVSVVITAIFNLIWPYLNGKILYDRILVKDDVFLAQWKIPGGQYTLAILLLVIAMFVTKLVLLIMQILVGQSTAVIVTKVVRDMMQDVFRAMGNLSLGFFRNRQTGSLMTRVLSDVERITSFFIDGFPYIFVHGFTIVASIIVMVSINWKITIAVITVIPILISLSMYLRPKVWVQYGKRHRAERSVNSQVNDNLTGARVVKSFGQEIREMGRFHTVNSNLKNAEIRITKQQNLYHLAYEAAEELAVMAIWIIGVYLMMISKSMELGTLITFVGYAMQLSWPLNFFARVFYWWVDSMNSAQRIFEILDSIPDIRESETAVELNNPIGRIELSDVTFGYEANRPVLKNIDLVIPEGKMIGVVGRSGAGKTTLVNLISRMYDPQAGSIRIDGINVKDLKFKDLRRNVAMVSQETFIFMGTVSDNIAYANPDASTEEIMMASKLASAHEFIMRMPDGYDTVIGAAGRELSGGERQRISIARAILANPKILILDEATASVDTETEQAIQKSINYLIKGRTTISIAHRLSTLKDADYLVVLDGGRITERGTHQELENMRGTYYKLMELQTKALSLQNID